MITPCTPWESLPSIQTTPLTIEEYKRHAAVLLRKNLPISRLSLQGTASINGEDSLRSSGTSPTFIRVEVLYL